jgi:xanthine/CO dehydrogenase XdhC/CoxF family maturation factor
MCGSVLDTATSRSFVHEADRDGFEAWIQYLAAVPEVLICGAGPDAVPLADLLATLGFPVTVTDHRPAYVSAQRFPAATLGIGPADTIASRLDLDRFSAAVVMSHHLASDTHYLRALASSRVPYVGALGPRKRRERLMKDLGSAAGALGARLRGPVGLDIGAITPEAIALAIAAEIHAFAAGRAGETHSRTSTN